MELTHCRLCQSSNLVDVIDLGNQILTSRFPVYGDTSTPSTRIVLSQCSDCGLVQLKHTVKNTELYEYEYGYRSGISNTMRAHLKSYNEELKALVVVKEGDAVLDIGSNDTTFLRNYDASIRRVGCDPTGKQFREYYRDDVELIPTYFTKEAIWDALGAAIRFKCVTSISMFYDLPDPVGFAKDVYAVLEEDGVWSLEQSYLLTMIERNSIDTICHEHLEYYGIRQIKDIMDRANFKIIRIDRNDCNGGSMRVYVAKKSSALYEEAADTVASYIANETAYGLYAPGFYTQFQERCTREMEKLTTWIDALNAVGKETWIYGASTKGNCLLQCAKIGSERTRYAVERNLAKVGKMTSTGVEIISEETMRAKPPACLLVLPWHFKDEIVQREADYLDGGGILAFPFPSLTLVSRKPFALLTGWNGQIAHYCKESLGREYTLIGTSRAPRIEQNLVLSSSLTPTWVEILKPALVIHLAGMSSSQDAHANPLAALEANGMDCVKICEAIRTQSPVTRLVHASSSEIFKGHRVRTITDTDTHFFHRHPYSIAKAAAHSMIQWYRETYGLCVSNAILFTTESPRKHSTFLLKKIANHIQSWKRGNHTPLSLGPLDSMRNLNHSEDIADALVRLGSMSKGCDVCVCGSNWVSVAEIVQQLYKRAGFEIAQTSPDTYRDSATGEVLFTTSSGATTSSDTGPVEINGVTSQLLFDLGWAPKHTLDSIVDSFLECE